VIGFQPVARMERSESGAAVQSEISFPDCATLDPGIAIEITSVFAVYVILPSHSPKESTDEAPFWRRINNDRQKARRAALAL